MLVYICHGRGACRLIRFWILPSGLRTKIYFATNEAIGCATAGLARTLSSANVLVESRIRIKVVVGEFDHGSYFSALRGLRHRPLTIPNGH